ncbi:MAG: glycosyl hydrolase [Reichenbachiella sp.]
MTLKRYIQIFGFGILFIFCINVYAQNVISVGSGSYASTPPDNKGLNSFINQKIYVSDTNSRPIPTNDWWTTLLSTQYSGNLWVYPNTVLVNSNGFTLWTPSGWNDSEFESHQNMGQDITVAAQNFSPGSAVAQHWGDWSVVARIAESDSKYMDMTVLHGSPFIWTEVEGVVPKITATGAQFYDDDENTISFPVTTDHLGFTKDGKEYGLFFPNNTKVVESGSILTLEFSGDETYFVIAHMNSAGDLSEFYTYAYALPKNTTVEWDYNREKSKINVTYSVTTENLKGESNTEILQGFLPHHFKNNSDAPVYAPYEYNVPRGLLKTAIGESFSFSYPFNGILPMLPNPETDNSLENAYDSEIMYEKLDQYATVPFFNSDTYGGGKDLLRLTTYMQMAKELDHPSYDELKSKLKEQIIDWLTYEPGENDFFFAWYDNWHALVGFNTGFGSENFNDHHFHYGYFVYSAAVLGIEDPEFLEDYKDMITLLAKEYANWDRNDDVLPFLRTFDPWLGHSHANGPGFHATGNDQESTSEAIQSWNALYMLGVALNDDDIVDAAIFGYNYETRAIHEYWYDRDDENFPDGFNFESAGILWLDGPTYALWFGGPHTTFYKHAIQWIPISPASKYFVEDSDHGEEMFHYAMRQSGVSYLSEVGTEWANIGLQYLQLSNPDTAAQLFQEYWDDDLAVVTDRFTAGITYYYIHSNRMLGEVQWDHSINIPTSTTFYNEKNDTWSYVAYNPEDEDKTCSVYKDGSVIGSFTVPPKTMKTVHVLEKYDGQSTGNSSSESDNFDSESDSIDSGNDSSDSKSSESMDHHSSNFDGGAAPGSSDHSTSDIVTMSHWNVNIALEGNRLSIQSIRGAGPIAVTLYTVQGSFVKGALGSSDSEILLQLSGVSPGAYSVLVRQGMEQNISVISLPR